jgi:PAS domain S-box-containing protein
VTRSAARALVGLGLAAIAAHLFSGHDERAVYDAIGLACVGLTLVAVAWYRPPNAAGWLTLAAAQAIFAVGDQVYDGSFPGPADALYVPAYAVWILAIVLLLRSDGSARSSRAQIDAWIVTGSVAFSLWVVFLDERLPAGSRLAHGVSLVYPMCDLVLLALLIRHAFDPGRRSRSFWWLAASVAAMPVADAAYVIPAVSSSYAFGYWADALWLFSYLAVAAAALEPSMRSMSDAAASDFDELVGIRRLYLLGAAVLTIPVAVLVSEAWHGYVDAVAVGVAGIAIVLALTARLVLIMRDLYRMHARLLASERKFRMVFQRSPIGISVGSNGIMSETNPALQRMLGYTGDALARMHYTEVTHPDDLGLDVQAELDAGSRTGFAVDKRYVAKDGRVVEAHVHVALDGPGGLGVSVIEDVTGKRELEEQLRQAQKMDAVGKLAGGIAHDFNNLMTAVIGYSDLLMPTFDGDVRREKIEAIRESAVRAAELTRQLLAFSRRQVMQTAELDLRDVVVRMDTLLRRVIGEDVRLQTMVGAEPVLVRADAAQLEQVVMNLVVNARDAVGGGGTITIAVLDDGSEAVLSVADDGAGMDEATRRRAFEPFFTTKALGEGSGLGLSTVDGIVGQSGGRIDVESAPGEGSVFTVRLPAVAGLPRVPAAATVID